MPRPSLHLYGPGLIAMHLIGTVSKDTGLGLYCPGLQPGDKWPKKRTGLSPTTTPSWDHIATPLLGARIGEVEQESILLRNLFVYLKSSGSAAMTCLHVRAKQQGVVIGLHFAEPGNPLGRFPVLDL